MGLILTACHSRESGNPVVIAKGLGMGTSALNADERVATVTFTDDLLAVGLKDGRLISVPLEWYPRLAHASIDQRTHWQICGGGYGIHWPDIDEYISTEGMLRGAPAPDRLLRQAP